MRRKVLKVEAVGKKEHHYNRRSRKRQPHFAFSLDRKYPKLILRIQIREDVEAPDGTGVGDSTRFVWGHETVRVLSEKSSAKYRSAPVIEAEHLLLG